MKKIIQKRNRVRNESLHNFLMSRQNGSGAHEMRKGRKMSRARVKQTTLKEVIYHE